MSLMEEHLLKRGRVRCCEITLSGMRPKRFLQLPSKEDTLSYLAKTRDSPPGARVRQKKMKSRARWVPGVVTRKVFADSNDEPEFRLKRKLAQEKDQAVIKFEELRFLTTKTNELSEEDAENKSGQNIDVRSRRRSFYYCIIVLIIAILTKIEKIAGCLFDCE
ncbi:hypothetical protein Tco_1184398 [Tanacetum coccineum]